MRNNNDISATAHGIGNLTDGHDVVLPPSSSRVKIFSTTNGTRGWVTRKFVHLDGAGGGRAGAAGALARSGRELAITHVAALAVDEPFCFLDETLAQNKRLTTVLTTNGTRGWVTRKFVHLDGAGGGRAGAAGALARSGRELAFTHVATLGADKLFARVVP